MKTNQRRLLGVGWLAAAVGAIGCGASDSPASGSNRTTGGAGSASAGAGGAANSGSGGAPGASAGSAGNSGTSGSGAAGSSAGTGGSPAAGTQLPLPVTVTSQFTNQGWFGDDETQGKFATAKPISQAVSAAGACAARSGSMKGQCLKISYTPVAGAGGEGGAPFAGVFLLTTLKGKPDANWGAEPGKSIEPGATKIAFSAAGGTGGEIVSIKAGVDGKDLFSVPETPLSLTTAWKDYTLDLSGQTYGDSVVGPFAWVSTSTTPITFYLDNIVWEK